MRKISRKAVVLLMAVAMIIAMAVPTFAANGMNGKGNGYYLLSSEPTTTYSTSDTVNVKVIVLGRKTTETNPVALEANRTVELTGSTSYTVRDVMLQFNSDSATAKATDRYGTNITSSSTMVDGFKNGSRLYTYLFYNDIGYGYRIPVDGWMFRVNGRSPMKDPTATIPYMQGAMMYETPIKDGDVVTFFFNYPFTISGTDYSTKFIAADTKYTAPSGAASTGTLQVQLQSSRDNHYDASNSYQWTVSDYSDFGPGTTKTVSLYDSDFHSISTDLTLDSTGYGTCSITLDPGVYYISVPTKTFKTIRGYTSKTGTTKTSCQCLDTTLVYDRFVVPSTTSN